ncbi:MAG: DUF4430 domain-containing protein [Oscillospiraceae bacterium]|nr:DUF4430 domain-containing protein [Oscillospiraceae bacterium]
MKKFKTILSLLLAVLIAVGTFAGCNDDNDTTEFLETLAFTLELIDSEDKSEAFNLTTTQTNHDGQGVTTPTLGEVMRTEGLTEQTGLIDTINGITADWDTDEAYWAFYIDGEYALQGIDDTTVKNGAAYKIVYTIGFDE